MTAIGSHHSARAGTDEWLTPPEILAALGSFDLDPCAPIERPWPMAKTHYTLADDGLNRPWQGRVWCNPPYGLVAAKWLKRLSEHGNGIALIFARTETKMFFEWVWTRANALLFIEGRLHFYYTDGRRTAANSGGPSVPIAYGEGNAAALEFCGIPGHLVPLDN